MAAANNSKPGAAVFSFPTTLSQPIKQRLDRRRRLPANVTLMPQQLPEWKLARIKEALSVVYIADTLRRQIPIGGYDEDEWNRVCKPYYEPAVSDIEVLTRGMHPRQKDRLFENLINEK